ncbi:MAG TPA: tetratricopeptide repeat protein [Xanthobacteraceae bacterium]|nr:tetratricopeptide repeat protein [Xanthobacteraceae bacterium]
MRLRIFVSSPGDVPDERLRAALVIDKLAQEFRHYFEFDVIRWEHEPLLASGHFQDALDPPSTTDIVILILWSRLGTPLPERTAAREYRGIDGRAPVTGTEWEYEDALRAARERGAPDLLAFRNTNPAPVDARDPVARARSIAQLEALDAFWQRHFADQGVFLAAYDQYATLEEFAARLEESLRKLLERRVKALPSGGTSDPTWFGSPFRGLQAYGFEHAAIYFGRDEAVAKAAEQLAANARAGAAFLLVSGASGSGKSSLVQAGLVPRLMQPQRIEGIGFIRRLAFRPGGSDNPTFALIEALTRPSDDAAVGLPELLAAGQSAAELVAHLRETPDKPGFVFAGALARVTQAARASGRLLAFENAKLILVIDQLEELFTTAAITADERRLFLRLLAGLARSGAVWVLATQRADFWHRAAESPELLELAHGLGRLDLAAPSPAEIAEMIRKPARAAGLSFETSQESGLGLDAVIAADAVASTGPHDSEGATSGVLPLLSFLLETLHAEDIATAGRRQLTFATYAQLKGLHGAMSRRADETVARLPKEAQGAVPQVLRMLVTIAGRTEQAVVARTLPLARFGDGTPARTVVDAFVAARLLVATAGKPAAEEAPAGAGAQAEAEGKPTKCNPLDEGKVAGGEATADKTIPMVRLAHEALITHWDRARKQFAAERRDLETHSVIERQQARWEKASGAAKRQLVLRDPDLANALDLEARWGDELDAATHAFIATSRQSARLVQRLIAVAALIFLVVAVTASVLGFVAHNAEQEAQRQRDRAEQSLAEARRQRERAEQSLAAATQTANGLTVDLARRFRKTSGLSIALIKDILERARALQQELMRSGQATPDLRRSEANTLSEISATLLAQGDPKGAFEAAEGAQRIMENLLRAAPGNTEWLDDLSMIYIQLGDALEAQGELPKALQWFKEALAVRERLAKTDTRQTDLWLAYSKIAHLLVEQGNQSEALKFFRDELALVEPAANAEPANLGRQHDLAALYGEIGNLVGAQGELPEALKFFRQALTITERLAQAAPDKAEWAIDLPAAYGDVASVLMLQGNLPEAMKYLRDEVTILERLAKSEPDDARPQRALSLAYDSIGDALFRQENFSDAREIYRKRLALVERLANSDPANVAFQTELVLALAKLSNVSAPPEARSALQRALSIVEPLARAGKLSAEQQTWPKIINDKLSKLQD